MRGLALDDSRGNGVWLPDHTAVRPCGFLPDWFRLESETGKPQKACRSCFLPPTRRFLSTGILWVYLVRSGFFPVGGVVECVLDDPFKSVQECAGAHRSFYPLGHDA